MQTFEYYDWKAELMKNPGFVKEYERMKIPYDLLLARVHMQMSQRELANLCGVNQGYICRIENGEVVPTYATLNKIAKCLGIEYNIEQYNDFKERNILYKNEK